MVGLARNLPGAVGEADAREGQAEVLEVQLFLRAEQSPSPRLRSVRAEAAHEIHKRRELPRLGHGLLGGRHFLSRAVARLRVFFRLFF